MERFDLIVLNVRFPALSTIGSRSVSIVDSPIGRNSAKLMNSPLNAFLAAFSDTRTPLGSSLVWLLIAAGCCV